MERTPYIIIPVLNGWIFRKQWGNLSEDNMALETHVYNNIDDMLEGIKEILIPSKTIISKPKERTPTQLDQKEETRGNIDLKEEMPLAREQEKTLYGVTDKYA